MMSVVMVQIKDNGDFNDFDSYGIESLISIYFLSALCDTLGDPEQMNGFLYGYENGIVRLDVEKYFFPSQFITYENYYDVIVIGNVIQESMILIYL